MAGGSFGGSVKLTGETDYQKALQKIKLSLQEVKSQMQLVTSEFGKNNTSISGLTKKQQLLNQQLEQQKQKVQLLKNQYTQLSETEDENSEAMSKLRIEINKAQSEVNKTAGQIDKLDKEMTEAIKPTEELGKEVEEAGEKAKKSGDGFTIFKGILANLGTQAINVAMSGLKNLGGAFISLGKQAISSYAEYEQLVGGVETLFGESASVVEKYASEAYKTAGLSANQYMQQVTSFSASLTQSLGGDTKKAAEYGNRAIIDMSDNANKMGTSMEMIQNAYQGFAKQNYTINLMSA